MAMILQDRAENLDYDELKKTPIVIGQLRAVVHIPEPINGI